MAQSITSSEIRPAHNYRIEVRDDGQGGTTIDYTIPASTEAEQDAAAASEADRLTEEWVRGGAWGDDGASVRCWIEMSDEDGYAWPQRGLTVDIEPNHKSLIAAADGHTDACGDDPDDHEWTREGEGGCEENPGVWSTGGTAMVFRSHCRRCGLIRVEHTTGSQRNPGEHDTVRYEMADDEQIACWRASGAMDDAE